MTQLRTAWRRAVEAVSADPDDGEPDLAELLSRFDPAGSASLWTCELVAVRGPAAAELEREAAAGPVNGSRLADLAAGITFVDDGVFQATLPGDTGPWLAVQAIGENHFTVATRSRVLLDDLRWRFRGRPEPVAEWEAVAPEPAGRTGR